MIETILIGAGVAALSSKVSELRHRKQEMRARGDLIEAEFREMARYNQARVDLYTQIATAAHELQGRR